MLASAPSRITVWVLSPARPVSSALATTWAALTPRYPSRLDAPAPGTGPGDVSSGVRTGTAIRAGGAAVPWAASAR